MLRQGKEKAMSIIEVRKTDNGRWKVTVNHVSQGPTYGSPRLANKEATAYRDKHIPSAEVVLAKEDK
jgi:hypothetical protein